MIFVLLEHLRIPLHLLGRVRPVLSAINALVAHRIFERNYLLRAARTVSSPGNLIAD
jgi:hypothetical protein